MGITVRYNKHLFLQLSVLFVCLLAGFTLFAQDTFAQAPSDTAGIETEAARAHAHAEAEAEAEAARINKESSTSNPSTNGAGNVIVPTGETQGTYSSKKTGGGDYSGPAGDNKVDSLIYNSSISLGGIVVAISGWVFDLSIDRLVLKMGCWFRETPGGNCSGVQITGGIGGVVNALWIVIRDLFNILFIFSLIFIGLKTIWSPGDSSTKKALGLLIAAALLINFSLYVTKVIVDMSNYAAVAIHNQATQGITGDGYERRILNKETGEEITNITSGDKKSLSGAYMQALQFSGWFTSDLRNQSTGKIITFSLMFLLTSIIVAIVFFWGGIMLITRFVALIIFMIFSPAMFLGWVLPQFQKYTSQWWSKFLSYAFFAPAYIFMLYLGLYTLLQLEASFVSSSKATYAGALSGADDGFAIFLFFAIGITFLVAATKVGESMSIAGAGTAMTTMKGVRNKIQGGAKWGVGYGASAGTGALSRGVGKWMDSGRDEKEKPRGGTSRAIRNFVKSGETKKWGGAQSSEERGKADKEEAKSHARRRAIHHFKTELASGDEASIQQAYADMTNSQMVEVAKSKEGRAAIIESNSAHLLTQDAMKAISDSDDINDTHTGKIAEARQEMTTKLVTVGVGNAKAKGVAKASNDELQAMGITNLLDPKKAINLSKDKIEKTKFIQAHKDKLIAAYEKATLEAAKGTGAHGVTSTELAHRKAVDIAKMPKEIFKIKSFVQQLPEATVKSKAFSELDPASQKSIRKIFIEHADSLPNNTDDAELNRIAEITQWFNLPGGKSFGR